MDKKEFEDYLKFAKKHYTLLADLMEEKGKEKYANEHRGKVKFIDLLLLMIRDENVESSTNL